MFHNSYNRTSFSEVIHRICSPSSPPHSPLQNQVGTGLFVPTFTLNFISGISSRRFLEMSETLHDAISCSIRTKKYNNNNQKKRHTHNENLNSSTALRPLQVFACVRWGIHGRRGWSDGLHTSRTVSASTISTVRRVCYVILFPYPYSMPYSMPPYLTIASMPPLPPLPPCHGMWI